MANQTVGINVANKNPYTYTLTNSGTLIGSDIELVVNLSTVTSKEDVIVALDQLKMIFTTQSAVAPPT